MLERIGHVVRMDNERLTKAMVFGWYEALEGKEKMRGRKRKTVLYWKRLLRESGCDWTDIERLCNDRDGWMKRVQQRMDHVYKWECQKGHTYEWGTNERSMRGGIDLVCRYEGCGEVCLSKAGQVLCMETEFARIAHERTCTGGRMNGDTERVWELRCVGHEELRPPGWNGAHY